MDFLPTAVEVDYFYAATPQGEQEQQVGQSACYKNFCFKFKITVNNAAYALETYSSLLTTTATAGGTTTLTATSAKYQVFTGSAAQTVKLPVATTLTNGCYFTICNLSTGGAVTVQTSGGNTLLSLALSSDGVVTSGNPGRATFLCINTAGGTGTASWAVLI